MTDAFRYIIRDGLETDIKTCLTLENGYRTEYVWQMSVRKDTRQNQVIFRTERLPRYLDAEYPIDKARLQLALKEKQCFLVVVGEESPEMLGYLTIRLDKGHHLAIVQDLIVSRPYRRNNIGSHLLRIARQWAQEQDCTQLTIELQTQNYPGIQFCQANGFIFCGYNEQYFPGHEIALFFGQSI